MRRTLVIVMCIVICKSLESQTYPGKYLLWFRDKSHNSFSLNEPGKFLSQHALDRRFRYSIQLDSRDIPVSRFYLDSLKKLGIDILNTSKWFNNCTVAISDINIFKAIRSLSFIDMNKTSLSISPYPLKNSRSVVKFSPTRPLETQDSIYGYSTWQIQLENGLILHQMGYKGEGIQIAVLDAGFTNADILPVFDTLWIHERILGSHDFVLGGNNVYHLHPHGTGVLSLMGGNFPGMLIGTSPNASFWLLRSEDANSEYIIEEDNWVAAAEFADSVGVDIITTSLGYTEFDYAFQNHTYRDMNGKSTRISIAADIAFSKGMLVVVSAGNWGNDPWHYISAPADAINAIAVGAVNIDGAIASFSSRGPSSDGRIKPNVVGVGWGALVAGPDGTFGVGSGTSYSAPIIAGLSACLWEAYPVATNTQIKNAIEQSSSQADNPDSVIGYGIPDFRKAFDILYSSFRKPGDPLIRPFPNPFTDRLSFEIFEPLDDKKVTVILWNLSGAVVLANEETVSGKTEFGKAVFEIPASGSEYLRKGIYIVKIVTYSKEYRTIAIKL
jgi:serine protease AprX